MNVEHLISRLDELRDFWELCAVKAEPPATEEEYQQACIEWLPIIDGMKDGIVALEEQIRNSIPKPVVTIAEFVREVERRAEENMMKTGKLEGSHYAAMKQYQKELGMEAGE